MPVKVIMPPASAPKIACTARARDRQAVSSPRCSSRTGSTIASDDRDDVGGEHRDPHRRGQPDPQRGTGARRHGPRGGARWWLTRDRDVAAPRLRPAPRARRDAAHPQAVQRTGERRQHAGADQRRRGRRAHVPAVDARRVVIATTSGSCVELKSASARRSSRDRQHAAVEQHRRRAAHDEEQHEEDRRACTTPDTLANSASTSSRIPLTTKKNGMKTPNATAVSFESNTGISRVWSTWRVIRPGGEPAEQQVEAEVGGEQREREHEHDDPAHGELRARLERALEQRHRARRRAHGEHRDADRERDEARSGSARCASRSRSRGRASAAGSARTRRPRRRRAGSVPNRVFSSPVSDRIGISVPIAVVASAEPV